DADAIDDCHFEPATRRMHCGRQPGYSGADHDNVECLHCRSVFENRHNNTGLDVTTSRGATRARQTERYFGSPKAGMTRFGASRSISRRFSEKPGWTFHRWKRARPLSTSLLPVESAARWPVNKIV